jgi:hypothetical protein
MRGHGYVNDILESEIEHVSSYLLQWVIKLFFNVLLGYGWTQRTSKAIPSRSKSGDAVGLQGGDDCIDRLANLIGAMLREPFLHIEMGLRKACSVQPQSEKT